MTANATPSPIDIQTLHPGDDPSDFIAVAHSVYASDPNWVAPLEMEIKDRLSPRKNPFWLHAEGVLFLARRDGRLVGRASAQIDFEHQKRYADKVGFFGFLDTIDDAEVARALLEAAAAWLKSKGMERMRGPVSLSINEELGCLVDGFDTPPMIMMPHHRAYQGALIESAGLTKVKDVFAWTYDIAKDPPPRAMKARNELIADPDVKIRTVDMKRMDEDMRIVMDIFNDAWSENWGFVPMTEPELRKTVEDFKLLLEPQIALIAEIKGQAAAISIAVPNLNEAVRDLGGKLFPFGFAKLLWRLKVQGLRTGRLILLGLRREYRMNRKYAGLAVGLYTEMSLRARALGMRTGELGWTLEDNAGINVGIRLMGGKVYKTYRVYERAL